jgi:hypothetical protein
MYFGPSVLVVSRSTSRRPLDPIQNPAVHIIAGSLRKETYTPSRLYRGRIQNRWRKRSMIVCQHWRPRCCVHAAFSVGEGASEAIWALNIRGSKHKCSPKPHWRSLPSERPRSWRRRLQRHSRRRHHPLRGSRRGWGIVTIIMATIITVGITTIMATTMAMATGKRISCTGCPIPTVPMTPATNATGCGGGCSTPEAPIGGNATTPAFTNTATTKRRQTGSGRDHTSGSESPGASPLWARPDRRRGAHF